MTAAPIDTLVTGALDQTADQTADRALDRARDLVRHGRIRAALEAAQQPALVDDPLVDRRAAGALIAECHLAQGNLDLALALGEELASAPDHGAAVHARAELATAVGEPELALARFLAVPGCADVDDLALPWRAGAALTLVRLGRRAEALALAREQHAEALARGTAYDVALALRVLATTGADGRRLTQLREALALAAGAEAGRLRAQIETDLAGLLLLDGDHDADALILLRSAETYAAREDLWPLQSRVRRLLDRMGEQPRRLESEALAVLTAAERRVAMLALEGLTNRQIAERLLVSIKAVEGHLSKVYRKLGLSSRTALVAMFGGLRAS